MSDRLLSAEQDAALDAAVDGLPVLQPPGTLVALTLRTVRNAMAADADQDAAFDAEVAARPAPEPPDALMARTLAAMGAVVASEAAAERVLDEAVGALPLLEPPAGLARATLTAVLGEMHPVAAVPLPPAVVATEPARPPANRSWRWALGVGALAAVALVLVAPQRPVVETTELVERGVGDRLPDVDLKVAVDHGGQVGRLARDEAYGPGDTLYFRAAVDDDASLVLVRVDAGGAEVVHTQRVTAGEADLALASGPLGWRLDPGERDAVFALLASPLPLPAGRVVAGLSGSYAGGSPAAVCAAAQALPARCAAELVKVSP